MGNLTNSQKSIWVTEQYYKGSSINNICGTAIIDEQVDFEKLKNENKGNILGQYIESLSGYPADSLEYQALCEGVQALMETRRG